MASRRTRSSSPKRSSFLIWITRNSWPPTRASPSRSPLICASSARTARLIEAITMGIFDRLSTLLRSNINDLISRAEDPEKMLNQILVDMRSQLAKAKQQVATAIADEKRLRDQADAEYRQGQDWEKRAMLAVLTLPVFGIRLVA